MSRDGLPGEMIGATNQVALEDKSALEVANEWHDQAVPELWPGAP